MIGTGIPADTYGFPEAFIPVNHIDKRSRIMRVNEIMTANPTFCTTDTGLQEVARMMVDCDCGAIPVVESMESRKPIGIVTDRDIVTRLIATGRNPLEARAADAMTKNTVTINADANVSDAVNRMEYHQIRRILVVDNDGRCVGILAQADVALHAEHEVNELVSEVSEKSRTRQQ